MRAEGGQRWQKPDLGYIPATYFVSASVSMERVKGIEPSPQNPQTAENQHAPTDDERAYTQLRAQIQGNDGRDLAQVVNAWGDLPAALKAAILAIVNTATNREGQ
jgi:hypothetical protein